MIDAVQVNVFYNGGLLGTSTSKQKGMHRGHSYIISKQEARNCGKSSLTELSETGYGILIQLSSLHVLSSPL